MQGKQELHFLAFQQAGAAGWLFSSEMLSEASPVAVFQVPKVPPGREQLVCTFGTAHEATVCVHEAKEPVGPLSEPVSKTCPLWKTCPTSMKETKAFPPELFSSTTSTDLTYPKAVSVTQKACRQGFIGRFFDI